MSCLVEQHVGGLELLAHNGSDRPGKCQLTPYLGIGGHAYNGLGRTEAGHHAGGSAAAGAHHDKLCVNVDGQSTGGVGNGVDVILDLEFCGADLSA